METVPRIFRELEDEHLHEVFGLGRILTLDRKAVLFTDGGPYRGPYVVLSGLAVVYKLSEDGRMLVLHVCRPGDALAVGPMFAAEQGRYSAHARVTRESEVLFLPRERFAGFLKRHPEVLWEMLGELASRGEELRQQLVNVTMREVTARLARYLLREVEASRAGGDAGASVELPIAKSSLASYLGTAHETLSRTFARLIKQGIVRVDGPKITILDMARLKRLE